jgi:hypothetical protein
MNTDMIRSPVCEPVFLCVPQGAVLRTQISTDEHRYDSVARVRICSSVSLKVRNLYWAARVGGVGGQRFVPIGYSFGKVQVFLIRVPGGMETLHDLL